MRVHLKRSVGTDSAARLLRAGWFNYVKQPFYRFAAQAMPDSKPARKYVSVAKLNRIHQKVAATLPPVGKAGDVILFSIIDWHWRIQRPQQLCRQFARMGRRVFYIESTVHSTYNRHLLRDGYRFTDIPEPGIVLCRLFCDLPRPDVYRKPMARLHMEAFANSLENLRADHGIVAPVLFIENPFWRPVAETFPGGLVVYDCLDHHAGFSTGTKAMEAEEERLLERADIVLTSSAGLAEKAHGSLLVRNGVEFDYFSRKPDVVKRPSARPVVGYYGAIADWFDMKLVLKAAQMFPEWDFWLIGAAYPAHRQAARDQSNIIWAGEVPYAELTAYLYGMDVCMIPFLENKLTRCTNPVKVYEYLAAGKPVVATALPELELMREHVQVAHNHDEFLACLRDAMANSGTSSEVEGRIAWAAQHDWSKRAGQIEGAIHGRVPLVSVIVLTHNQIEKTKACLNSLLELTDYPNFEILVVDNASSDGTIEYVSQLASRDGRVQLITNSSNTGFPAGSNIGLRAARGEYFVLLNNDTVCTRGWLRGLVRHLMKDARLGAVGPVTNNIGNEARIKVSYSDMEEMAVAARRYTVDHLRQLLFVEKIAFFCVAFSRRVYEQVGPLDERFGLGLFEDDDYCNRIRSLGYKIAICEDVFIHHELSASFGELAKDTHESLFEKNRQYYEEKWGVWWPHFYRKIR